MKYTVGEDNDGWYITDGIEQICWCMSEELATKLCAFLNYGI